MKRWPTAAIVLALVSTSVAAQTGPSEAEQRLHTDWAWLARYQSANAALPAVSPAVSGEPRVVLMGDSITEHWQQLVPDFFDAGRLDRGISGQTTPQMLLRFRQDVIDLHPAVVQIMAGTNDIAQNTGPMTVEQTEANIRTMTELAQAHGIRVVLASIPPAAAFPWRPEIAPIDTIRSINAWLRRYATETGSVYADYWSALEDGKGGFREGWSSDGVHPNRAGYAVMAPIARKAIAEALARPAPIPLPIAARR